MELTIEILCCWKNYYLISGNIQITTHFNKMVLQLTEHVKLSNC